MLQQMRFINNETFECALVQGMDRLMYRISLSILRDFSTKNDLLDQYSLVNWIIILNTTYQRDVAHVFHFFTINSVVDYKNILIVVFRQGGY